MNKHRTLRGPSGLLLIIAAALVAGCAGSKQPQQWHNSIPVPEWLNTQSKVLVLYEEQSYKIEQAAPGEIVDLGVSPWGGNTRLQITPSYFSATGKTCFSTLVTSDAGNQPSTLCKYPEGYWGATRSTGALEIGGVQ